MTISDDTWARLRGQVDAAMGSTFETREDQRRRDWQRSVEACGWDGRNCRVDPKLTRKASIIHQHRVMQFWLGLIRNEYVLTGDESLLSQTPLWGPFMQGRSPWDPEVTQTLSRMLRRPIMTRKVLRAILKPVEQPDYYDAYIASNLWRGASA